MEIYGDLLILNVFDSYSMLEFKTLSLMRFYLERCYTFGQEKNPAFLKMDDDLIVNPFLLLKILKNLTESPIEYWAAGQFIVFPNNKPVKRTSHGSHPFYLFYPFDKWPPDFLNGPTFIFSGETVRIMFEYVRCLPALLGVEDVELGGIFPKILNITIVPLNQFYTPPKHIDAILKAARENVGQEKQSSIAIIHPYFEEENFWIIWKFFVRNRFFVN